MPGDTRNKFPRHQREAHLARVAQLYLRGIPQYQIARECGVTRGQITYDIKLLDKRWQQSGLHDINAAKAQELAKINDLERTYWEAWDRSMEARETSSTKLRKAGSEGAGQSESAIRKEQRDGNPSYLAGVQWCIEKRCKLLGLDAPVKIDITDYLQQIALDAGLDPNEAVTEAQRIVQAHKW